MAKNKSSNQASYKARTMARLAAVQAVYTLHYDDSSVDTVLREFMAGNLGGFALMDTDERGEREQLVELNPMDASLFASITRTAWSRREELTEMVKASLSSSWPPERVEQTLMAVLLAATAEIIEQTDTDVKIIISDYVHVARAFYHENEPKMVNAVLDKLARRLRENEFEK